jgi:hypothetical protein
MSRPKGFGDDPTIMVREWRPSRSTVLSGRRQRDAAAV